MGRPPARDPREEVLRLLSPEDLRKPLLQLIEENNVTVHHPHHKFQRSKRLGGIVLYVPSIPVDHRCKAYRVDTGVSRYPRIVLYVIDCRREARTETA